MAYIISPGANVVAIMTRHLFTGFSPTSDAPGQAPTEAEFVILNEAEVQLTEAGP